MARILRFAWQYEQWRHIARDDYIWKCVCAMRWPSVCKRPSPPTATYYKLYRTFYKRQHQRTLLPPRLSFNDLDFFIHIWTEDKLIFSEVVPGPVLQNGFKIPPIKYKITLPVEPRDLNSVRGNVFGHVAFIAFADITDAIAVTARIRAWISLLFMEHGNHGIIDVFGIEMDFCDAANSKEEVLWLLEMLDWK
ncbi:Detected protein of confused Function [Hibiscus syriacus]|uniref:Detected protein of confused Function n=1 Tax=Hibiscus syriacus TaxID=106335 RepID=A0A6A2WP53_HIBSY|nr:Detected protein of confused Function [Hibiscus syriacus]